MLASFGMQGREAKQRRGRAGQSTRDGADRSEGGVKRREEIERAATVWMGRETGRWQRWDHETERRRQRQRKAQASEAGNGTHGLGHGDGTWDWTAAGGDSRCNATAAGSGRQGSSIQCRHDTTARTSPGLTFMSE